MAFNIDTFKENNNKISTYIQTSSLLQVCREESWDSMASSLINERTQCVEISSINLCFETQNALILQELHILYGGRGIRAKFP